MPARYTIRYLSIAQKDLTDIVDYIARDSAKAAAEFIGDVEGRTQMLTRHPRLGVVPKDPVLQSKGYRMLVVGNYLVFYVILGKRIEIRRVLHSKRSYSFLLE